MTPAPTYKVHLRERVQHRRVVRRPLGKHSGAARQLTHASPLPHSDAPKAALRPVEHVETVRVVIGHGLGHLHHEEPHIIEHAPHRAMLENGRHCDSQNERKLRVLSKVMVPSVRLVVRLRVRDESARRPMRLHNQRTETSSVHKTTTPL